MARYRTNYGRHGWGVVEARQIRSYLDLPDIAAWCGGSYAQESSGPAHLLLPTPHGVIRVDVFDWVIKNERGEFVPCDAESFPRTFVLMDGGE